MRRDPFFITWKVAAGSAGALRRMKQTLSEIARPDSWIESRVATLEGPHERVRARRYRLGDYFERLCVLPPANGDPWAVRLFLQRKHSSGRYWKELMVSVLSKARQQCDQPSIDLEYRVDDEKLSEAAAQVPGWFGRIGAERRGFWESCATYLLTHSEFTFSDLQQFSGIAIASLRAMHRNSYRAIKQQGAPNPLLVTRDPLTGRFVYRMEPVIRDAILCAAQADAETSARGAAEPSHSTRTHAGM